MAKRKATYSEHARQLDTMLNQLANPKDPALDTRLHQDLYLSKGERQKGPSPAYAIGKKVAEQERKRK